MASVSGDGGAPYRRDRVYLTETAEEARTYAALYVPPSVAEALERGGQVAVTDLGGDVYEVEPIGGVVEDGDYQGATAQVSWEVEAARVVRVVERGVPVEPALLREAARRDKA